ncbi:hypothetical protein CcaverHIS002_0508480 [Cutaneotrichosporon cavernicola]|nr:hypothetical protein CcaverHIS002_0508480 [Cutaneotrichosporon cavernicola]
MPDTDLTPHRTSSSDYQTQCTTLEHLEVEAKAGRVVLRVYSQSSACRLNWTGEGETSGFSSLNHHLGALTPTAYADALISNLPLSSYTPWANWTDGFYLRQTIIDHTNKRVQATFDVPWDEMQVGADGLSPWISASRDPGWAVWEVARRLAQVPGESVHIAVIAMQPKALLTPARGAAGEVVLDPYATLLDCKRKNIGTATQGRMTNNAKEAVERSLFGVNASSEVLFYGRIFADSIVSVMEFTHDHLPLGLPPHWLAQPGKTWMDSLVWDPYEQAYDWHNARQRIATVAAGGELPSLGKLTTRTSYAPHPSVTRRGTISSVNISIHTGQNGDLEDIAPGAHTVPTDAKVHSTYSPC